MTQGIEYAAPSENDAVPGKFRTNGRSGKVEEVESRQSAVLAPFSDIPEEQKHLTALKFRLSSPPLERLDVQSN
jgi:hypothetical protein